MKIGRLVMIVVFINLMIGISTALISSTITTTSSVEEFKNKSGLSDFEGELQRMEGTFGEDNQNAGQDDGGVDMEMTAGNSVALTKFIWNTLWGSINPLSLKMTGDNSDQNFNSLANGINIIVITLRIAMLLMVGIMIVAFIKNKSSDA